MTNEEAINELIGMYDCINDNIEIRRKQYEALNMAIELIRKEALWEEAPPHLPTSERRDCLNCMRSCTGRSFGGKACDKCEHK
jgi:hypothetical protein